VEELEEEVVSLGKSKPGVKYRPPPPDTEKGVELDDNRPVVTTEAETTEILEDVVITPRKKSKVSRHNAPGTTTVVANEVVRKSITLHYFPLYARGEQIRVLLTYLQKPFENHVIPFAEWPHFKTDGKCEFGQIPICEIDGKTLSGSTAISRYIAMTNDLYPTEPKAIYACSAVCDILDSIYDAVIVDMVRHNDEKVADYFETTMPAKL
jgi:hypothetical protein